MKYPSFAKPALATAALVMAAVPVFGAAQAQDYPPPNNNGQSGYDYRNPPPEPGAPNGYDGRDMPPPPPGYTPSANDAALRAEDARYADQASRWARDNCVKSQNNAGSGALIGGILGAVIGSGLGGRHDRGGGIVAGAAIGAVGGAAIGSASGNETSPGCPPGYSVRRDAVSYGYTAPGYYYAAPEWYRPWVFIDGNWSYRPYPYHNYYYHTWRGGRGYGHYRGGDHRDGHGDWGRRDH